MIRTLRLDPQGSQHLGGSEQIDLWRTQGGMLWVDLQSEVKADETSILESLGCHPLAIQDALRDRHPPKIEQFHDSTFVLYRGIATFNSELEHEAQTIAFFINPTLLITRHPQEATSVERLFNEQGAALLKAGPGHLALKVMHTSAGLYLESLLEFEARLSDVEDTLLEHGSDELMKELVFYRSRLVKLRRLFNYHKNITDELRGDEFSSIAYTDEAMSHSINDLHDRFDRLYTMAQMFYDICGDLIDGYISISSHQLNRTMQVLTVITAIFIPLGFLAGLYGMNFDHIPELHMANGYYVLLSVMGTIAVGLLVLFRRMRWL
ncbi:MULTISPECIES: magnesium transporter CorA family protein [Thalassolituus]|jgi:magnesium transporter|uniref:magnesium transporter CorA family protein n=1 Tax=Thalassolituus TaxID=187492 RepID=UPI001CE2A65C|nr:magnesium transporter CorA family protein [Thalassolituus oleivorans]MCA6127964.1 metal transporter [Thalassolituus oleivorans 4BN06-13]